MTRIRILVCLVAGLFGASLGICEGQQIGGGGTHSFVIDATGQVWMTGSNSSGWLGDGTTTARRTRVPLSSLGALTSVAAGAAHTVAVKADGTVWAWGGNAGQIGDGTTIMRTSPTAVSTLSDITAVAANGTFSLARKQDGTVWAWGVNNVGQLGDGTTTTRTSPVQVSALSGVIAITAGADHALALKSDGTIWAWGANTYGQLGDNTNTSRTTPAQVPGLTDIIAVAAGHGHSLAVKSDGTVWSWGYNVFGQLGDGTATERRSPVAVTGAPSSTTRVYAGAYFSALTTSTGQVWTWGENGAGQLGDGTTANRRVPGLVADLPAVEAAGAGSSFMLAVESDGAVWAWGRNSSGELGDGTTEDRRRPTQVSAADYNWRVATPTFSPGSTTTTTEPTVTLSTWTPAATIHYTTDGSAPSAASTAYAGPISVSVTQTVRALAVKAGMPDSAVAEATYTLRVATPTASPGSGTYTSEQTVTLATSTSGTSIRYTTDGTDPTESSPLYLAPLPVALPVTVKVRAFRSGWSPSTIASATYSFNYGTLPAPTASISPGTHTGTQSIAFSAPAGAQIRYTINGGEPTAASALYGEPLVVATTTTVRAKTFRTGWTASPTFAGVYTIKVPTPQLSLTSGAYAPGTTVSILADPTADARFTLTGAVPTTGDPLVPTPASLAIGAYTLSVRAFKSGCEASEVATATYSLTENLTGVTLSASLSSSLLLRADGSVFGWGQNTYGRLADGTTTTRPFPVVAGMLTGIVAIASGDAHTLAVKHDGTVLAIGFNGSGRLGDGTQTTRQTPVAVVGLTDVRQVAAGSTHSLALRSDGTVWAWGGNTYGQLGDGTTTSRSEPTQVPGLTGIVGISTGALHSLAVTSSGTVWAWGANHSRQLGDGTTASTRTSPVAVDGLADAVSIAAGATHSLALTSAGSVKAWGSNSTGELGDASTVMRAAPVSVASLSAIAGIAAGTSFSVAIGEDGRVWTWGTNAAGQLGAPSIATGSTIPVELVQPTGIAAVAAGASHVVTVATDGTVWAWGDNTSGQVGDGTTWRARSAVALSEPAFTWRTPTPTLSLSSGTYAAATTVTVSHALPGVVLRYSLDGTDPDETATSIASGSTIAIDVSRTVKVRAWATGRPMSHVASGIYILQPAQPSFSPNGGNYTTPQTVTISAVPGATVRWTLDGTDPVSSSSPYTAPVVVSTSAVLKARAFRTGWEASVVRTATYSYTLGTTAAPHASPGAGTYETQQTVTLTADTGATIRYTIDGSEPTASSASYTAPLTIGRTTTVKARAYKVDWTPGPVLEAAYVITDSAPEITARVYPVPNSAGWYRSDVTVTFDCRDDVGVASCSPPATVTTEGVGQNVTGTVTDSRGQTATVSVTLNIDKTRPTLSVSAPLDGSVTTAASVAFDATSEDGLAGVTSATCAGVTATVVSGNVQCAAVPLAKGRNVIIVAVEDAAGNRQSITRTITRAAAATTLTIGPEALTLAVDETNAVQVLDDYGQEVPDAVWTVDDPLIAEIVTIDGTTSVHALAAGVTTLSASRLGVSSAPMALTVVAGSLSEGTLRWTASPSLIDRPSWQVASAYDGVAEWYGVSLSPDHLSLDVQALRTTGVTSWSTHIAHVSTDGTPRIVGSSAGGVLILGTSGVTQVGPRVNWRYDARGFLLSDQRAATEVAGPAVAQASDGTVYVVEYDADASVVALDGVTGQPKWRLSLPSSAHRIANSDCEPGRNYDLYSWPEVGTPAVDSSDTLWLQVRHRRYHRDYQPCGTGTQLEDTQTLQVVRITAAGVATWTDVFSHTLADPPVNGDLRVSPRASMPDEAGGALLAWDYGVVHPSLPIAEARATYVLGGEGLRSSGLTTTSMPGTWGSPLVASEGERAYGTVVANGGGQLVAFDVASATSVWTQPLVEATLYGGVGGGGVATTGSSGLTVMDETGLVQATSPVGGLRSEQGLWLTSSLTAWEARIGPLFELANVPWPEPYGNGSGQYQAACTVRPKYAALAGPVRLLVPLSALTATEDALLDLAAKAWTRVVGRYKPSVTIKMVRNASEGTGQLFEVSKDPTLMVPGEMSRAQAYVKFNSARYDEDTHEYIRWLMLHEIGHVVGLDESNCNRLETLMGNHHYGGFPRLYAAEPTEKDRAVTRKIYVP